MYRYKIYHYIIKNRVSYNINTTNKAKSTFFYYLDT